MANTAYDKFMIECEVIADKAVRGELPDEAQIERYNKLREDSDKDFERACKAVWTLTKEDSNG